MNDDWKSVTFDLIIHSEKNGEQEIPVTVNISNSEWADLENAYAKGTEIMCLRGLDFLYDRIIDTAKSEYENLLDGNPFSVEKIEFPYEIAMGYEERSKVSLANAVFGYFSTLYDLNRKLIMLHART